MPIEGSGWEFHIVRQSEQKRASDGKRRTVGKYQIFHDGVKQTGAGLSGTVAETRGPGANKPAANNRRVEEGRLADPDGRLGAHARGGSEGTSRSGPRPCVAGPPRHDHGRLL